MKLIGELKEKVEASGSVDDVRQMIEGAGMELTDEGLDGVVGGMRSGYDNPYYDVGSVECPKCGKRILIENLSAHNARFHRR